MDAWCLSGKGHRTWKNMRVAELGNATIVLGKKDVSAPGGLLTRKKAMHWCGRRTRAGVSVGAIRRRTPRDDGESIPEDWEDWLDDEFRSETEEAGTPTKRDDGGSTWADWAKQPRRPSRRRPASRDSFLMGDSGLASKFDPDPDAVEGALMFEARVNRFESRESVKYVAMLFAAPILTGFLVNHLVADPILQVYGKTHPKVFEMTSNQKVRAAKKIHMEEKRIKFNASVGHAPSISQDEMLEELEKKARELQHEQIEENRIAMVNVFADGSSAITLFALLLLNRNMAQVISRTLDRLFTGLSDTGKAFIIILITDILLGYHSEAGWHEILKLGSEHYGLEAEDSAIYLFVAIVPVTMDSIFKYWVFRYLNRLAPSATVTYRAMNRH
uniref:Chloroplast envelope membrane protein n=1 Tax=Picocystis salinarum TaxID=88271 RepID=A0A7S3UBX4_9CHLO|mmetsp:Transcript_1193/g.7803  ORF Transcript_1193/g.7803 Transcript_1193/m.7803 type:complete len:387 (+) Transcript_1193:345-1505(+)